MKRYPIPRAGRLTSGLAVGWLALACSGEVGPSDPVTPIGQGGGAGLAPGAGGSAATTGNAGGVAAGATTGTGATGNTGTGATGNVGAGGSGATAGIAATGGSGATAGTTTGCTGDPVSDAKRVVRLSFNQISVTLHQLFGDTLGTQIDVAAQIGPEAPVARTFPPLAGTQEGQTIIQKHWQTIDQIATMASQYVFDNLDAVTGCGAAPADDCARTYVTTLATKAFRRPLTAEESTSLLQVYDEVKSFYGTVPEAVQYSVAAVLQSSAFLYRTEFGDNKDTAGLLSAYELASELSYFLTDGPPDDMLLASAAGGTLTTAAELEAQAARLLQTPAAQKNLGEAMFSYFKLDSIPTVQIDDTGWTSGTPDNPYSGVRESSYHEAELFLQNSLWTQPLTSLLMGKQSWINATLAPIYEIAAFPPAGVTPDADGFAPVTLPDTRAGMLTQVGFLAARSRPDIPSVVGRGLAVNAALLCAENPPFPEDPAILSEVAKAKEELALETQRVQSEYRTSTVPCVGCHANFDAYGLALENYDGIGRYRTVDPEGRPIDASVTLPPNAGDAMAVGAVDMGAKIAATPGFDACVAKNMLNWALAEGSQLSPDSCATQEVASVFAATDKTFASLMQKIAVSQAFMSRQAGVNQ